MGILDDKLGVQREVRDAFKDFEVSSTINLPMTAEADLDVAANLETTVIKLNTLMGKLRNAGLLGV